MIDMFKNPPPIFEDVIKKHFKLKKNIIEKEINLWIEDSKKFSDGADSNLQKKLDELMELISKLP
jgi:hypothetical protein